MSTATEKTVEFRNIRIGIVEVLSGAAVAFGITATIVAAGWKLSTQISDMQKQIDALQKAVTEIRQYVVPDKKAWRDEQPLSETVPSHEAKIPPLN
jgi:hypothetical protein